MKNTVMTTVRLILEGSAQDVSFESYRAAQIYYESLIAKFAPLAQRQDRVYNIDEKVRNRIVLMRGRFYEEWVNF